MITITELLAEGFIFANSLDDDTLIYYLSTRPLKAIVYTGDHFELVLNGCCSTKLNIENINDILITIELLSNGIPVC